MIMVKYDEEDIEIVMKATGYDKAKAEKYFIEVAKDVEDEAESSLDVLDIIHDEVKAKANGCRREYVATEKTKNRKPREKKVDEEKKKIIEILQKALTENGFNAIISNVDKSIDFDCYSVNLVKHRTPKK